MAPSPRGLCQSRTGRKINDGRACSNVDYAGCPRILRKTASSPINSGEESKGQRRVFPCSHEWPQEYFRKAKMRPDNVALFGHHKDQRKTFFLCRSTATLLSSEHQYICAIGESICALKSPYTKYPSPCVWPCLRPAFDAIWGISAAAATCNFCDPTNRFCIGARPGDSSDHHFSSFDSFGLARLAASATWIPPLPRVSISWAMHISGGAPLGAPSLLAPGLTCACIWVSTIASGACEALNYARAGLACRPNCVK